MPPITIEDNLGIVRVTLGDISPAGDDSDFGLQVVSSDGSTVIVDGTSDIFTIIASGTLTTAASAVGAETNTSTTLSLGLSYRPLVVGILDDPLASDAVQVPYVHWDNTTGTIAVSWSLFTEISGSNTVLRARTKSRTGHAAATYKYFVLKQVAF